jgi:hypothetical protein
VRIGIAPSQHLDDVAWRRRRATSLRRQRRQGACALVEQPSADSRYQLVEREPAPRALGPRCSQTIDIRFGVGRDAAARDDAKPSVA